jgi:hypothetical protein
VAQVLIEAENIRDAHNRAFAKIREDFPGIEPAAHDSLIVETVTSFIEPDTASRCV